MNLLRKMLLAVATLAVLGSSAHAQTRFIGIYQPSYGNYGNYGLYNRPYYWQPNLGGGAGYFGSMSLGGYGYYPALYYPGGMGGYAGGPYGYGSRSGYGGAYDCFTDETFYVIGHRRPTIYPAVVVTADFDLRHYLTEEKEPKTPKK